LYLSPILGINHADFIVFANFGENLSGGRPAIGYAISLDIATELAMNGQSKTDCGPLVGQRPVNMGRPLFAAPPFQWSHTMNTNAPKAVRSGLTPLPGKHQLTVKQQFFVAEYLIDLNATKAAERAGYSKRTAASIGQENLNKPEISAAITEAQSKRFQRLEITAERVLVELALIAFSNMLDYITVGPNGMVRVDLSRLTRDQAAAISEITVEEFTERTGEDEDGKPTFENVKRVKFKLSDKRGALVDLGKHLKLFTEKVEVGGSLKVEVQDVKQKLLAKLACRAA
jgi:phage terminase small subunit